MKPSENFAHKNSGQELDDFIEALNQERKPTESSEGDVAELQALARSIKGLRQSPEPRQEFSRELYQTLQSNVTPRRRFLPWSALVACVIVLIFLISPWSNSDKDIVLAMEQTVQKLQNYHGILEKVSTNGAGERQVIQKTEIWTEGDNYLTRSAEGSVTANNGERRWKSQPTNKVITLLPVYLDPHDFDLRHEAAQAQKYPHKVVGQDSIAGRNTTKIEITPPGGLPYYLWIDTESTLPVRLQTAMQKSVQTTYTYTALDTNVQIPDTTFSYNLPEGYQVVDLSPNKLVSGLSEAVSVSGLTPLALTDQPQRVFASPEQIVYDFGETVVTESKASAPMVISPLAALGEAAGVPLEVFPDSLRWQQHNVEIRIEGPRSREFAQQLVKDLVISQGGQVPTGQPAVTVDIDMAIVKQNQQQVDSGSSPWQLDPVQVAFTFANLKISPSGITGEPPLKYESLTTKSNSGSEAVILVAEGPVKTVYLKRLIRQDQSGIWTVVGYDPR